MIQAKRKIIWDEYYRLLKPLADKSKFKLPKIPDYATNNGHMFYIVCNNIEERTALIGKLKDNGVGAVFHYLSLHSSPYYVEKHDGRELPNCDMFANCLLRLPMFYELEIKDVNLICNMIVKYSE